ncbi:MAG TPA: hypothetical protein VN285_08290 [Candidatus Deferrimicrobium sp.]|nr:hypothetical protein [Candidatus Deferrimicrobium sp.]
MDRQVVDLIIAVSFLGALVLVARKRDYLSHVSRESFRLISSGLVVLSLTVLMRLFGSAGIFASVPFLNESLFFQLTFWIGVITGLILLVSGVSNWLPLSRSTLKATSQSRRHFDFVRNVDQLFVQERQTGDALQRAVKYMVEHFDLQHGAVFGFSRQHHQLVYLGRAGNDTVSESDLKRLTIEELSADSFAGTDNALETGLMPQMPPNIRRPDSVLPVTVAGKLSVLFLLWRKSPVPFSGDDRTVLQLTTDIVSRAIERRKHHLADAYHARRDQWLRSLEGIVDAGRPMDENVSQVAKWLTRMVPVDLVSIAIVYERNNVQRFTKGEDGAVLNEKRVDVLSHRTFLNQVFETSGPVIINDTIGKTSLPLDQTIVGQGMRSLAAFRLGHGQKTDGALVVASRVANRFGPREVDLIQAALQPLSHLIAEEVPRYHAGVGERRLEQVNRFLADCGRSTRLQDLFNQAAGLLVKELKTSMARVSTYEYNGAFLKSRALACQRPIEGITPSDGHMILSQMPFHTLVRESGRLMLINQELTERKISESEAQQICRPDLKSALLVPVMVGRQALAVISLIELRGWERFRYSQADILFTGIVAAGLSLAIQIALSQKPIDRLTRSEREAGISIVRDPEMRGRIRSSVSSILGSVEMIKSHKPDPELDLDKYLGIIDRSANRINEYFLQQTPS